MDNLEERLLVCFAAVFPERSRQEILSANMDSIPEWDSLRSITLLTLLQQEFAVSIDLFDLEELRSFELLLARIRDDSASGGSVNA